VFASTDLPEVATPAVRDRMRRARSDLRSAASPLRPPIAASKDAKTETD
jgi:hypothetical protein